MSKDKVKNIYSKRIVQFQLQQDILKKRLVVISVLRFIIFITAIVLFIFLVQSFSIIKAILFISFLIGFIYLVIQYLRQTEVLKHYKNLIEINTNEAKVLENEFSSFHSGEEYIDREHRYAYDLDLFGEGSLFQYINRTVTLAGRELLVNRLLNSGDISKTEIINRQLTVKELMPMIDWRQDFIATGYNNPVTKKDNKKILFWINSPVFFIKRIFYQVIVVLLPILTIGFLGLSIIGISHYSWFVFLALTQLFIASLLLRRSNKEQSIVSEELRILKNYSKLIQRIENENFRSNILKDLQSRLKTGEINAQNAFKKLIKIIDAFDTRLNIFLGVILNGTLMWDLYSLMRLERWKLKYGQNVEQWIHVISEFEFYISIANYSFNNPDFCYPEIDDNVVLNAQELCHPLIPYDKRVNNDFNLSELGKIEIITGANMAGKSTFLRTVGVNIILALNGFPVCAKKFTFRVIRLYTGMRTADSLKENESYFYAELKRLKNIIEELQHSKPTLILLDEILKGTNSIDKAKGSWKFVENLIKLNATGIVATHDLSLCEIEKEYPKNIENKCFEVEIQNDQIKFDYKLRSGITKNMNASLLMKQMGIFSN